MERFLIILLLGCANFLAETIDGRKTAASSVFTEIRSSKTFVDKTLWLKEFYELPSKHVYLTAPLRFGKTTNLKMMEEFFSITNDEKQARELFEGTNIHSKEKSFFSAHFRKYPVIYLNFKPLLSTRSKLTFRENVCQIFTDIRNKTDPQLFNLTAEEKIAELKEFNKGCTDEFEFKNATIDYTKALHTHYGQKIIVLIDEMDALTRANLRNDVVEQNAVVLEFGTILKQWLERNEYVEKSLSVGAVFTDELSHVDPYPDSLDRVAFNDQERFAKYFGLTDKELEDLFGKFSLSSNLPRFKSYYDGYTVTNSSMQVYNTISPTEFVMRRKFLPYWAESVIEPLKNDFLGLFSRPEIGSLIEKAIFPDMNDLPKFAQLNSPVGKDMFHMIRGNDTVDKINLARAGDVFIKFLEESGYVRMVTADGFLATNQDAAFALGTTLARDSNFYENARNISSAAKMKLVAAVKNLAMSEETMIELAGAVHGLYQPACSLVTEKRVSFGGPIFTILAYADPEAFEAVLAPEHAGALTSEWSPDVALVRKDSVAFVFKLRRGESARNASEAVMASKYEKVLEENLNGLKIESTIFVGISLDDRCEVSVSFGKQGMSGKEIKEVSNPIDKSD
nr:PREDICTED: uncharacterized protein LOC109044508 [Bemisia tabaci]